MSFLAMAVALSTGRRPRRIPAHLRPNLLTLGKLPLRIGKCCSKLLLRVRTSLCCQASPQRRILSLDRRLDIVKHRPSRRRPNLPSQKQRRNLPPIPPGQELARLTRNPKTVIFRLEARADLIKLLQQLERLQPHHRIRLASQPGSNPPPLRSINRPLGPLPKFSLVQTQQLIHRNRCPQPVRSALDDVRIAADPRRASSLSRLPTPRQTRRKLQLQKGRLLVLASFKPPLLARIRPYEQIVPTTIGSGARTGLRIHSGVFAIHSTHAVILPTKSCKVN